MKEDQSIILDPKITKYDTKLSQLSLDKLVDLSHKLWLDNQVKSETSRKINKLFTIKYKDFDIDHKPNLIFSPIIKEETHKIQENNEVELCNFPIIKKDISVLCTSLKSKCSKHKDKKVPDNIQTIPGCDKLITRSKIKGIRCNDFCYKDTNRCHNHQGKDTGLLRTFKVRIFPDKEMKKIFKKWFSCCRRLYNLCINHYKSNKKVRPNKTTWKKLFLKHEDILSYGDIPYGPKEFIITEAITNIKNATKKYKSPKFNLRGRTSSQSLNLDPKKCSIKDGILHIYKKYTNHPIKFSNKSIGRDKKLRTFLEKPMPDYAIKLLTFRGKYWLCIPESREVKQNFSGETLSIDPGLRSFIMGYDPNGRIIDISDEGKILKIKERIENYEKKKNGKKCRPLYRKLTNIISNSHYKIANLLVKSYKNIILPKFQTQKILEQKKIGPDNNFILQYQSHFKFRKKLEDKAAEYGTNLYLCSEQFTSKTCGRCFMINDVGSSKVYNCKKCGLEIDRDINGARNILIKQVC